MPLGKNQLFDRNSHCTCRIFCIHFVVIIWYQDFRPIAEADEVVHADYIKDVAIVVPHGQYFTVSREFHMEWGGLHGIDGLFHLFIHGINT